MGGGGNLQPRVKNHHRRESFKGGTQYVQHLGTRFLVYEWLKEMQPTPKRRYTTRVVCLYFVLGLFFCGQGVSKRTHKNCHAHFLLSTNFPIVDSHLFFSPHVICFRIEILTNKQLEPIYTSSFGRERNLWPNLEIHR